MAALSLAADDRSQLLVAILATWTAWSILRSARIGLAAHRPPRVMLGVVIIMMATTYWVDVFDWLSPAQTADLRRGIGFALYVSLIWTANTGRSFWKRESKALQEYVRGTDGD